MGIDRHPVAVARALHIQERESSHFDDRDEEVEEREDDAEIGGVRHGGEGDDDECDTLRLEAVVDRSSRRNTAILQKEEVLVDVRVLEDNLQ